MTDVQCQVGQCKYNENGYCQESDITIGQDGECWTYEESFEHCWEMMDDIEREEYNRDMGGDAE